jgi:hypothetical protein
MVDFKKVGDRKVVTKKMKLTLEIELIDSLLTVEDAVSRLEYVFNSSRSEAFSSFIVALMRETSSSMWELDKLSIDKVET